MKNNLIDLIKTKKSTFWEKTKNNYFIDLFAFAANQVPAYRDFLKKAGVVISEIKTVDDTRKLPVVDKKNYLRKYSLPELTVENRLDQPLIFTSTSGSTGEPFYFHRSFNLDWQSSIIHELFYLQGNYKKNEPILVVVCFGMGIWIGGLITYEAFHLMQKRGYNLSLITPGINKEEIFKSLKNLGPLYKNIILVGYPPFIKDIIDEAPAQGIDWAKFNTRVIFAAEAFTEYFRDYIAKMLHIKDPLKDTMNIYGTADLGTMAFETPFTILLRRLCLKNEALFHAIFGDIKKTPTLCQYIPSSISFDMDGENILVSGNNTIPLVRYSLGDHGGIYTFTQIVKKCKENGVDLEKEIGWAGIKNFVYELPLVYVYERKDLSIKLYGAIIYPEHIREALQDPSLANIITGKFTIASKFDKKYNEYMEVNCELKKDQKGSTSLEMAVKKIIIKVLLEKNAEYHNNFKSMQKKVEPRVVLWQHGDPLYFKSGLKQKWVAPATPAVIKK